jgi:DNA-binding MarR family transcriptional regulator
MSRKLSQRETDVLRAIDEAAGTSAGATGTEIARLLGTSQAVTPAAAHQTAASLCRKGLAWRAGTPKLQWYKLTEWGRRVLAGDVSGEWVAR